MKFVLSLLLIGSLSLSNLCPGSATWKANPTSGDWNAAANWTPETVPNGETDIATFRFSNITNVSTSLTTDVDSVLFRSDANAYTLTVVGALAFNLWGAG